MMGDNDFPIAMGGQGGSPYEELDPELLRRLNQPSTAPAGGFKEFLKQYLPKVPGTQKPSGYVQEEKEGTRSFAQSGTDVPDFQVGQAYEQREGGPVFEQTVAGGPSFDLRFPKMPGIGTENQSTEGLPNASPELLRKFVERKLRNPGGQDLPGFLKKASFEGEFPDIAQSPRMTPVQAAAKNFGDLPIIGPMFQVIRDYEDKANYRNADPRLRKMMHLE